MNEENNDEDLAALREAAQNLVNSMACTPVIYDDGKDDGTNVVRAVWLGKPITGPDAGAKAQAIMKAKNEEYDRIGAKAFEDTEPLENALLPGEGRFVPPLP